MASRRGPPDHPPYTTLDNTSCRAHRPSYPLDMALFLYGATFAVVPYYLWRTQRWRGIGKIGLLAAVWVGTYVLPSVLALLIVGE
jgi:hypothetical protein